MEAFLEEFQHLKHFNLKEIKSITGDFDNNKVIGEGGFGKVYEGVISDSNGQNMVAFKRLGSNCGQGNPEFLKEIFMLSRYTHENLISLNGFCDEDGEKILVYERASHGSLDGHLSSTTLTWRQRLKICLGAAKGLCYLHDPDRTQQRVIHRDIKSSNILLDDNWNAKVSDMGLAKISPANQTYTFVATNVVGTFWYVDPVYLETSILTKESDVYSFGLVLFEVLCGRQCFENDNGIFRSLKRMWKKNYQEKKLEENIFQELKQNMDKRSLEAFSDIAYRCLHEFREDRPNMSQVVEKLEIALRFQEISVEEEYEEMIKTAAPPLIYRSDEELKMLLFKGILVNGGKTWFLLNKDGEHSEMICSAECLIAIDSASPMYKFDGPSKTRFPVAVGFDKAYFKKFKTHVRTQYLSPNITYTVNLVFNTYSSIKDHLFLKYMLAGDKSDSILYTGVKTKDGWLMAELYHFTSDGRNFDLEIMFECEYPLVVEGIEFHPLEKVEEHEVLEDEELDLQMVSDSDTYWEQKLPTDYQHIIKWSVNSLKWTTKKELYSILCKGFPISNNKQWFSLTKDGKKCHMLSARNVLDKWMWNWGAYPHSRFGNVAFDPDHGRFHITCSPEMLSPQKTYAIYLVYTLHENRSDFQLPVEVSEVHKSSPAKDPWHFYLQLPQIPIIRPKVHHNTHNPLNTSKMKGLPRERIDGWSEVQVWEFRNGITSEKSFVLIKFTPFPSVSLQGFTVEGIEYRPI